MEARHEKARVQEAARTEVRQRGGGARAAHPPQPRSLLSTLSLAAATPLHQVKSYLAEQRHMEASARHREKMEAAAAAREAQAREAEEARIAAWHQVGAGWRRLC